MEWGGGSISDSFLENLANRMLASPPTENPGTAPSRDLRQLGAEKRMSMWVGRSSGQIWTWILESGNPVESADPVVLYINDKHLK